MAHRLIARFLVIALLFQALAVVPATLAACPVDSTAATTAHDCSGDGDDDRHACPRCATGISHGACASMCAAPALPIDLTPGLSAPEHPSTIDSADIILHDQRYAPPDPPPIL